MALCFTGLLDLDGTFSHVGLQPTSLIWMRPSFQAWMKSCSILLDLAWASEYRRRALWYSYFRNDQKYVVLGVTYILPACQCVWEVSAAEWIGPFSNHAMDGFFFFPSWGTPQHRNHPHTHTEAVNIPKGDLRRLSQTFEVWALSFFFLNGSQVWHHEVSV